MNVEFPDAFTRHAAGKYWGISPESILLYNNAAATDDDTAWTALRRYYDLTIYVTNHKVEWGDYAEVLGRIVEEWFDDPTTFLAQHATSETARQFVLGAAYEAGGGVMRLLRAAQEEQQDMDPDEPLLLSRRDLQAIADEADIKMLRSLGALRATTDGYRIRREVTRTLYGSRKLTQQQACWAILARICDAHDISECETVVPRLLEGFDIDPPSTAPADTDGSLPIYAGDARVKEFIDRLASDEADEVFAELAGRYEMRAERFGRTTGLRNADDPGTTPEWPLSNRGAAVCAVASRQRLPVATDWLLLTEPASDRFELRRTLDDAGFDVALDEDLLVFKRPYDGPTSPDAVADYESHVETERADASAIESAARRLVRQIASGWSAQRDSLLARTVSRLDDMTVAPTRFVFSMFDPVYHADEYEIEEYVGDSPHLRDEIKRIREWRETQPHDATTFAAQVRETCARPLEDDSVAPRLRIMSPWVNFTVQEYTALFQRLLANDIQVQLLLRLPDPSDWNDLKQDFLTRIGDTQGNLAVRTYTRYKKFKDHTQLRKLKRGKIDEDNDRFVSETGVHAKLYVAGSPENGEVLAGSANLMENSFYYNPEAGLHTQHPEVIETASDYFDLIWELAAPDEIDESVFTGKTNFEFYPKVYRP